VLLLLVGIDNRVIKARMGYSTANRLPLGSFPFPSRHVHPRRYLPGELAGNYLARKGPVGTSCRRSRRPKQGAAEKKEIGDHRG
jgi:hypothetical protein